LGAAAIVAAGLGSSRSVCRVEDIIEGLENTPRALIGLLAGENRGKRMIKV